MRKPKYHSQELAGNAATSLSPAMPQFLHLSHLTCFLHQRSAIKHSSGWEANEVMSVARWLVRFQRKTPYKKHSDC